MNEALAIEAREWGMAHGFLMRKGGQIVVAPFALTPRKMPVWTLQKGYTLAPLFSRLVDRISRDTEWLFGVLERTATGDDAFTGRLLRIAKSVAAEGQRQPISFGILRSDYMLHEPVVEGDTTRLLQVELNTIAASFGCLSAQTTSLHKHLYDRFVAPDSASPFVCSFGPTCTELGRPGQPINNVTSELVRGFVAAHTAYGSHGCPTAVLFVVQPGEGNIMDQRLLEFALWEQHGIPVIRRTLRQLHDEAFVGNEAREDGRYPLFCPRTVAGDDPPLVEISVAYLRAGYSPGDYHGEEEWEARAKLERSRAIKAPDVFYHLVGTKKVQQVLASPGEVERFLPASDAASLRECFASLWSLDPEEETEDSRSAVARAMTHPQEFVLKPQREGGGNNIYGDAVAAALRRFSRQERQAHILMERIRPRERECTMVRGDTVATVPSVCELGVYGVFLGNGSEELHNVVGGHLLRTKSASSDEGGIATGFSVADSPLLE